MKKFTIDLDVDDVLAHCIELGWKELGIDPQRITDWNLNKTDLTQQEKAAFLEVVCSPALVEVQKPYPGAAALIEALRGDGHEVLISSAVKPHSISVRSKMLMESFPMLDPNNIMTDRAPRSNEVQGKEYLFVSQEEFRRTEESGKPLESTLYAGHRCGIAKEEIERVWEEGRIAIKPADINGAKAIKAAFPDRTLTFFVRRNQEKLLKCLIEREIPISEKTKRILPLDNEYANEAFCDWTISNNGSPEHAVEQVLRLV